jgi:hypothetical protein
MAFEPENPLEKALVRAVHEPDARPEFYRLLMSSDLYVGGRVDGATADELVRPANGSQIHLAIVERNGRHLHPIFTAASRARLFSSSAPYFQALGRDLFTRTIGATFVLNPGSEAGKELVPDEIQYWLNQLVGQRIEVNAKRTIRPAQEHPQRLLKALGVLFVNRPVATARLAEIHRDGQEPRLLLAIEGDLDWRKLAGEIATVAGAIAPEIRVDVVSIDPQTKHNHYTQQLLSIPPFFAREPIQPEGTRS